MQIAGELLMEYLQIILHIFWSHFKMILIMIS